MYASEAQFQAARARYTTFAIQAAHRLSREVGFSYKPVAVDPDLNADGAMQAEYRICSKTHRGFRIWSGASDNTVFTTPEGNYAFRFWHDVVSHAAGKLGFNADDELKAGMQWVRKVAAHFGASSLESAIAYADTCGQTMYAQGHGAFPDDQLGFVREYVTHANIEHVPSEYRPVDGEPDCTFF